MSRFFIDRPVFAWVIALVLMLAGLLGLHQLPVAQYPNIAPPTVSVSVVYPGASPETILNTVVQPIEQQLSGLDGLEYIASQSEASGAMEIDLTFAQGTDPNIAQVQVQNKVSLAEASLPAAVTAQGLTIVKATKNFITIVALVSDDPKATSSDIADYVVSNLETPLTRITGVGNYTTFGSEYAMRIWLDPAKLQNYGLTVGDVQTALLAQNVQVSSGELGGLPSAPGQHLDATIIGPTQLQTPEEFGAILMKTNADGSQVRLRDVSAVELGNQNYTLGVKYNGKSAAGIGLMLAPGANQLQTSDEIHAKVAQLSKSFPPGMHAIFPVETAPYIILSVREVVITLIIAVVLVFFVMLLFLQSFRATLVPTLAVPVVMLGTFATIALTGGSINTLDLLAMVLAIGLLVDDAIVVVENVERVMHDEHLDAREATKRSMDQITGALVGIGLVLSAVFLPMAFFGGSAGVIYRQFSLTIVTSMVLSVLVALVFTPALCATLLKPGATEEQRLRGRWGWFNRGFAATQKRYTGGVKGAIKHRRLMSFGFGLVVVALILLFGRVAGGFLPNEDQGKLYGQVTMRPGATAEETQAVLDDVRDYLLKNEKAGVDGVFTVTGYNFTGQGQSAGFLAVPLKSWDDRKAANLKDSAIAMRTIIHFASDPRASVLLFSPPAVAELGNATGFDFELEGDPSISHDQLLAARNQLLRAAAKDPVMIQVRPNGLPDAPQYSLKIDRERAMAFGLSVADVNTTVAGAFGSIYVNQFVRNGRTKQVYIQGQADSRMEPGDLRKWYVRNASGGMVPFSSFLTGDWTIGPQKLERFNGQSSFEILGSPAAGYSTGQAIQEMQKLATKLPAGIHYEWTGLSFEQNAAGNQVIALYAISLIVVFLCLAALYESWSVPTAVMLVVPLGVIGAVVGALLNNQDNDIYFQVGLLTTVGLATKNAILIVEFAKQHYDATGNLVEAAITAATERLRPILMTSLAFVMGVLPLVFASGAGSGARVAIGTAVVGGMVSATIFAIFFVPVFYVTITTVFGTKPRGEIKANPAEAGEIKA